MAKKYPEPKIYKMTNPEKYVGDVNNIIARSNLERKFFRFFDMSEDITKFSSEEFFIPYYSPVDKKMHRYFVDVMFEVKNEKKFVAEIKPHSQISMPKKPKKQSRSFVNECLTYEVNKAKWTAAEKFCKENNMQFIILTEKNLPNSLK
jgi:hypothetical protein